MFDLISTILHLNTNTLIFNFVMNNVLLIGFVMMIAKIFAKVTKTSKDDTILGLIEGWIEEVKTLGRGVAKTTSKVVFRNKKNKSFDPNEMVRMH